MTRVCALLNNDFTRDTRVDRELRTLTAAGYSVTLFAPRSPSPLVATTERAGGLTVRRVFPERLDIYNPLDRRALGAARAIRSSGTARFDIVHAHDAEMLPLAWLLSRRWRAALVYDAHEHWPSIFEQRKRDLQAKARAVSFAPPGNSQIARRGRREEGVAAQRVTGERGAARSEPSASRRSGESGGSTVIQRRGRTSRRWRKRGRQARRRFLKRMRRRYGLRRLKRRYRSKRRTWRKQLKRFSRYYGRRAVKRWFDPRRRLVLLEVTRRVERCLAPRSDALITTSDSMSELYLRAAGAPSRQQSPARVVLRNMSHYAEIEPVRLFHRELDLPSSARVLLYTGWIRAERGVWMMLEAIKHLGEDVVLVLMGPVAPHYLEEVKGCIASTAALSGRAFYKEPVPTPEILRWTAAADFGLAPIQNTTLSKFHCLPNKLFEYVQAGIPVGVSDFPEMAGVVRAYGLGVTFDPHSPLDIASEVGALLDSPGLMAATRENVQRAKHALCWEREERKLLELYRAIAEPGAPQQS